MRAPTQYLVWAFCVSLPRSSPRDGPRPELANPTSAFLGRGRLITRIGLWLFLELSSLRNRGIMYNKPSHKYLYVESFGTK